MPTLPKVTYEWANRYIIVKQAFIKYFLFWRLGPIVGICLHNSDLALVFFDRIRSGRIEGRRWKSLHRKLRRLGGGDGEGNQVASWWSLAFGTCSSTVVFPGAIRTWLPSKIWGGGLSNLIVKPNLSFKTKSTLAYSVFLWFFLPWLLIYGLRIMSEFLFHSNSFFLGPFPIQC